MNEADGQRWDSASYVRPRPDGEADAWTQDSGGRGTQRLVEVTEVVPPAAVATALRLPSGGSAIVRRRLILLNGRPVELADSYYPLTIAAGTALAEANRIPGGATRALAARGFRPDQVIEELSVRPASSQEAVALLADGPTLVIEVNRVVSDVDGTPYEVMVMIMLPEGRRFRYQFRVR